MAHGHKPVVPSPADGESLLALARKGSREAQEELRAYTPAEIVDATRTLSPKKRVELLELSDHVNEIVPLIPEALFTSTLRAVGLADAGWLVEHATPEQRIAAVDLDCWQDARLSPSRLLEWIDAMVAAGEETLLKAFGELDTALWIVAMKSMGEFSLIGAEGSGEEADDEGLTEDGLVAYAPRTGADEERIREILRTSLQHAPNTYAQLVFGAMSDSAEECAELAAQWHENRLNDLGFPSREQAMRAYRPLRPEETRAVDVGRGGDELQDALVASAPLPQQLEGTFVGRALGELPAARATELLGYVLSVANTLAVADELPLAESESVERSLRKALRGIDRGLRELSHARNEPPARILDQTAPLDLFRIGATADPETLGRGRTVADFERDEQRDDWSELVEQIEEADRTIAADGKPR